jgi:hypothetical protein
LTHAWVKHRAKTRAHTKMMRERPELRGVLYGQFADDGTPLWNLETMSPAMRRLWEQKVGRPNILRQARNRAIGLDDLYPAQPPSAKQRNEET